MPGVRRLWTGPYGSALRDRVLPETLSEPSGAWIVASPLARDQVRRQLGLRLESGVGRELTVWCWPDLWRAIGDESRGGPAWLSEAAARAALGEAIARARGEGLLQSFAELLEWPGFRRRLRSRIAAWTRAERPIDAPPPADDPMQAAQWAIFVRYRAVLRTLDAEDTEGFAAWASRTLQSAPGPRLKRLGEWTFLDLEDDTRAVWRVLEHAHARAESVQVTLAYEPDEALNEVYCPLAPLRQRLLDWGFSEVHEGPANDRPPGLASIERELFRSDAHTRPALTATDGVRVIGTPKGEGEGLVMAREVAGRLRDGADPEDVLVLFRRWDDDAELVFETLRAWGLPVAAAVGRPLAREPAVSALLLAMKLPVEGWETARLVQLLRHGQVRPQWPEAQPPMALAVAASAVRASRVFRGRDPLRKALDRAIARSGATDRQVERARQARDVVERMIGLVDPLDWPGRWREQVRRLRDLAEGLQLGSFPDVGLDALWAALDDHGAVLEDLGWGQRLWAWADFTREVEALVRDLEIPPQGLPGSVVRLAAIDDVAGARAGHIVVGNLAEGTFPVREAVEADLDRTHDESSPDPTAANPAFAREMLRFLRVVGSAETSLVLVHPTTDAQGQELLAAGFLDDVLRLFGDEKPFHTSDPRVDPSLMDRSDLSGAPTDQRVRAVALACERHELDALNDLARSPLHRPILDGTAAALHVLHERTRNRGFGPYDGRLADPRSRQKIAEKFAPEYTFSPSQLESYIFCPFQFYLRYVLKLEPVDERDELEEDFTERGSRIHYLLELLEQSVVQDGNTTSRLELAKQLIENEMRIEPIEESAVEAGLQEIDRRRLIRTVERYVRQHEVYERLDPEVRPAPKSFEIVFGSEDKDSRSFPALTLGDGMVAVRLQGKIDRLDLLHTPGGSGFRVIDYKTGSSPSKSDVKESLYLQLPLYALAVERLVLKGAAALHDVGYWRLSGDGFKTIRLPAWAEDQQRLENHVIDLVNHLRHGIFAVDPRKDDCTQRCEFAAVCRIGQIRAQGKRREDVLRLELKTK